MKFKFCGNIDCPEWLITEITYLNKINAVKLRIMCNTINSSILSGSKDYSKTLKMLEEISFSEEEASIIVGVLHFLLKSASKYEVDPVILNQELQQLGLPQENADSIVKVYKSNSRQVREKLENDIFKHETPQKLEWKISYVLADKYSDFTKEKITSVKEDEELGIKNNKLESKIDIKLNSKVYSTSKEVLGKLINDLDRALILIKQYSK